MWFCCCDSHRLGRSDLSLGVCSGKGGKGGGGGSSSSSDECRISPSDNRNKVLLCYHQVISAICAYVCVRLEAREAAIEASSAVSVLLVPRSIFEARSATIQASASEVMALP